jgi:hypothetical protein
MFKKIFINFLMLFVLVSFSWAGVYRGKFIFDYGDGNPDSMSSSIEEKVNDIGLIIEKFDLGKDIDHYPVACITEDGNRTNLDGLFITFKEIFIIKNPSFSVDDYFYAGCHTQNHSHTVLKHHYYFLSEDLYHGPIMYFNLNKYNRTNNRALEQLFTENEYQLIKEKGNHILFFRGRTSNFHFLCPQKYPNTIESEEFNIMLFDPVSSDIQLQSNIAYIETESGINFLLDQEQIPIFENRDTDNFNYSFIKCANKPERLEDGNIKCYANQIRQVKTVRIRFGDNPNKTKEKLNQTKMTKIIERVSGFRTDRVYVIYDPIAEEIVERSQNLYLE